MLNTVIDTFRSFFSRAFWLGSFLPVTLFAFLHLVVAWLLLPDVPLQKLATSTTETLVYFPATFAALVVIAYALTPIIPFLRGLLDGSLLPGFIHDALRREHIRETRPVKHAITNARNVFKAFRRMSGSMDEIWNARVIGNASAIKTDGAAIDSVADKIAALQQKTGRGETLTEEDLQNACDLLLKALKRNATTGLAAGTLEWNAAQKLDQAQQKFIKLIKDSTEVVDKISRARDEGNTREKPNGSAISLAAQKIEAIERKMDCGEVLSVQDLQEARNLLITALKHNATTGWPENTPQWRAAQELVRAQQRFMELLKDATNDSQYRVLSFLVRYRGVAYRNPQATRMADTRLLVESYSSDVYDAEFEYIWPRLQLVLPQQGDQGAVGSFNDRLYAAQSQVDFAILSLALVLTVPLIWLPYLVWNGNSPFLFLAIGAASPLVAAFFHRLSVESEFAFGEIVKAAIDKYRLDLLTSMRQPQPATLSAERRLWRALQITEEAPGTSDIVYKFDAARGQS